MNNYFLQDLRVLNEIEESRIPRRVKIYQVRRNPFEELDAVDFKIKYRFSKPTASFLINLLKPSLLGDARGGFIPPELKVLAAVRTWARGEIQDDAGDICGVSQPAISMICKQVALAIVQHRANWIRMPHTNEDQRKTISGFYGICGFRKVIGAIDCTHIRIPKIGGDLGQYYINRKGYSSINVQVVCNANLEIMDIVAHWRGSTHDSRIFNESRLKNRFEQGEFTGRLLGDSGYACTPYLFTPVLNPRTEKEELYNQAHIRTRNTIERCFGVWKQRFRCLLRGFTTKLDNTKLYIVALAILHNIAIKENDEMIEEVEELEEENTVPVSPSNSTMRGNAVRAAFINENF